VMLAVSDANGNIVYSTDTIVVQDVTPPVIGSAPASATNNVGDTVNFSVTATACTPLTYQWFYNSAPLAGQTNSSLALANVGFTNAGGYFATATAAGGSTTSSVAMLTIVSPPVVLWSFTNLVLAADTNCAAAMPDVTGTNYILAAVWAGMSVITQSPDTNAVLAIGATTVVLAVADDYGNTVYSTNVIVVQDESPPVIGGEPAGTTNNLGDTVSFALAAWACTPVAYQWYFANAVIAGQTNATLTLADVSSTNAGGYFAVATAAGGSVTSSVAQLTLAAPLFLRVAGNPGDGLVLWASGPPGGICIWEMTTNLAGGWQDLFTNDFGAGSAQFADPAATNDPQRFYRARLGP